MYMDNDDIFDISFGKSSFRTNGLERIRYGAFKGRDGELRFAAFRVTMLEGHFAIEAGTDLAAESEAVVNSEEALTGPRFQAYEWTDDHFEGVDAQEQVWFKFK